MGHNDQVPAQDPALDPVLKAQERGVVQDGNVAPDNGIVPVCRQAQRHEPLGQNRRRCAPGEHPAFDGVKPHPCQARRNLEFGCHSGRGAALKPRIDDIGKRRGCHGTWAAFPFAQ